MRHIIFSTLFFIYGLRFINELNYYFHLFFELPISLMYFLTTFIFMSLIAWLYVYKLIKKERSIYISILGFSLFLYFLFFNKFVLQYITVSTDFEYINSLMKSNYLEYSIFIEKIILVCTILIVTIIDYKSENKEL